VSRTDTPRTSWHGVHKALADPLRIRIWEWLAEAPRSARQLAAAVPSSSPMRADRAARPYRALAARFADPGTDGTWTRVVLALVDLQDRPEPDPPAGGEAGGVHPADEPACFFPVDGLAAGEPAVEVGLTAAVQGQAGGVQPVQERDGAAGQPPGQEDLLPGEGLPVVAAAHAPDQVPYQVAVQQPGFRAAWPRRARVHPGMRLPVGPPRAPGACRELPGGGGALDAFGGDAGLRVEESAVVGDNSKERNR
jgi:hypothetical protein